MNRREFTTSLVALAAAPLIPLPTAVAASRQMAIPAGTYAWAQLIARAQNKCSPEILARQLHIAPDAAKQLFNEMLRDGVLRAPGMAGIAQATQPIDATGTTTSPLRPSLKKLRDLLATEDEGAAPLVKDDTSRLGCDMPQSEEDHNASAPQPVQESP